MVSKWCRISSIHSIHQLQFINSGVTLGLVGNHHFWRGTPPIDKLGLIKFTQGLSQGEYYHAPKSKGMF